MEGRKDQQYSGDPSDSPRERSALSHEAQAPPARSPDCPPLEEWGLFEAGLLGGPRAAALVEHASECGACGALLADMRSEDVSSDAMLSLRSSTAVWKHDMAARLAASNRPLSPRFFPPAQWWLAAAASVLLLAGGATWWWLRINSPEEANRLLARSYSEHRPFDLRFPGASYKAFMPERSPEAAVTVELREAQALIARKLRNSPDNMAWLQADARAELLSSQPPYTRAIQELVRAEASAPADSGILGDLGIAYLQSGMSENLPKAVDAFGRALQVRPNDPVLRFNLAIAYDRQHLYTAAVEAWKAFLAIEKTGDWAKEAQGYLEHDEKVLRVQANDVRGAQSGVPEGVEPGESPVFDALRRWISPSGPANTRPPTQELRQLAARFSSRYGDWWLSDLLAHPSDVRALKSLELAEGDGRVGDPAGERSYAQKALREFQATGNQPGALRARFELLYSFQRSSRPGDCLRVGESLSDDLSGGRYPWLQARAWVEQAGCRKMMGDFASALSLSERVDQLCRKSGLLTLHMRALSMRATALADQGMWRDAWVTDLAGLAEFWRGRFPPARAYQLYYTMGTSAQEHGFLFTAAAFGEEAVAQVALTGNRTVEAMARMRLANLDIQLKNFSGARAQTESAMRLFNGVQEGTEKNLYLADGEIGLARVEVEQGNVAEAVRHLRAARLHLAGVTNETAAMSYFRAAADVAQRQNDVPHTEQAFQALARIAAAGLESLHSEDERQTWMHELDDAYRGLTRLRLKRGDTNGALEVWESYRTAHSQRNGLPGGIGLDALERSGLPFSGETTDELIHGLSRSVGLVYVQMDDGIAAWRLTRAGAVYEWIPESKAAVENMSAGFLRNCADSTSRLESLEKQGQAIYNTLVAPVLGNSDRVDTIVLETDGPSTLIPFEALTLPDGSRLGDRMSIVLSPAMASYREDQPDLSAVRGPALVVDAGLPDSKLIHLPPLHDAAREASEVAALFPVHSLITAPGTTADSLAHALPAAAIFHFAGHALNDPGEAGLVLSGGHGIEIWNAAKLRHLDLRSCRLTVLSACATSPMDGWGIADPANLAWAFLAAGVPHVVASRWPVDSVATRNLMSVFYASLKRGNPVATALRDARNSLRITPGTSHPSYWAAFSAFGSL